VPRSRSACAIRSRVKPWVRELLGVCRGNDKPEMMTIASTPGGKFTMVGIRAPASNMCPAAPSRVVPSRHRWARGLPSGTPFALCAPGAFDHDVARVIVHPLDCCDAWPLASAKGRPPGATSRLPRQAAGPLRCRQDLGNERFGTACAATPSVRTRPTRIRRLSSRVITSCRARPGLRNKQGYRKLRRLPQAR